MIAMNTQNEHTEFARKSQESLEKCELEVRRQGGEALAAGHYREAENLAKVAKKIGQMRESLSVGELFAESAGELNSPATEKRISESPRVQKRKPKKSRRKGSRPEGYPYFEVEGNHLVKVSWSKTKKSDYVHKAPKRVLDKLVETLNAMGSNKEIIPTDKMFPLSDGDTQYPDYQSYLCLLWLKMNKLVIHQGREGYQLRDPESFLKQCEQLWDEFDS